MTPHIQPRTGRPDLRRPDHRRQIRSHAPIGLTGAAADAIGVAVVAMVYRGAPFVARSGGPAPIAMEVHENAVRPRMFVGVCCGLPFLDPPARAAIGSTNNTDAEE